MTTIRRTAFVAALSMVSCSSPTEGPDPNAPAAIVVEPGTSVLVSLGDTVELSATVTNGLSQTITASVVWASNDPSVVVVDGGGHAVAIGNGTAVITATAGSVNGTAAVTVEQVVDTIEASGEAQAADVGAQLDSAIVVTLFDARWNPVANAPVAFSVASSGGSVSPAAATTDSEGSAATMWTLGPSAGLQELEVVAGFSDEATGLLTANGYPLEATTLTLYAGDGQSELVTTNLAEPLQVQVLDSLGNGVPDVLVTFSADGDATLDSAEVYTDLDGVASVGLTLGTALGTYAVTAAVPDSMTVTGLPLAGSPLTLGAEAVAYGVAPVSTLTVGDTVTLTGTGLHPSLESNSVLVGGAAATILGGSQTELTIEVPGFGCTPERGHPLEVSRAGSQVTQSVTVTPVRALTLAVGQRAVVSDASDFCLQFLPGSNDEYVVGLTSTSWFDGGASFSITALDSLGPFPTPAPASGASFDRDLVDIGASPAGTAAPAIGSADFRSAEIQLREQENRLVSRLSAWAATSPSLAPPLEGDQLQLRLPDLTGDPCLDYVPVTAEVFSVGARLALATSAVLPGPLDPLIVFLLEAANTLNAVFGDTGIDLIMGFLGAPALWDTDSRVTVVLVPEVAGMGVPAFASAVDQLPRSVCPSSDEGNYVYVAIPDAATTTQLAVALGNAPPDLAHHIAHIVQWTRRLTSGGNLLPSWVAEGQAELIVEHVGMTLSGLGAQQDLGSAVLALPGLSSWIPERFDRLARFQGWDGAAGTITGAPEECSLFGFVGATSVCDPEAGPGAAWSFLRYVSDRFGPSMIGGEPALHHAIIDLEPTGDLIGQLENMLGVTLPELIVDWAGMLYADGRLTPAQAPTLQMTSWRLQEMIPVGPKRLTPARFGFSDFARDGTLVGGGTAYTLVTSNGAHGPIAMSIDDGAGGAVPGAVRPRLWVLRMR